VHDLDRESREPQDVAVGHRAKVLHRRQRVLEPRAPCGFIRERDGVGLVHEDRELSREVPRLAGVVQVGVRRDHRDRFLPRSQEKSPECRRLEAGVDDDRVIAAVGRQQPAVRAVRHWR
jgi:hypothetical protein